MAADLAELMNRYCDGDASAFSELYAQVAPRLMGYLARMTVDRAVAEDLVQITFLKLHKARTAYVRGADPLPWLFSIAHRSFLDEARRGQRARVRLSRDPDAMPESPADITGRPAEDPAATAVDPELTRAALAALDGLPARQREALVLTKLSGKSIAEAAAITGATPGAIKLRIHRGYLALRKALAGPGQSS